jgi:stage V sporulation protein AE
MISGGNPTRLSADKALECILNAPYDPVIVMVDDKGKKGMGPGECLMETLLNDQRLQVIGVVAVASDTRVRGVAVDKSVTIDMRTVPGPVDKCGYQESQKHHRLEGDTVEILRHHPELFIIGCGDLGKMNGRNCLEQGARVAEQCFREILKAAQLHNFTRQP